MNKDELLNAINGIKEYTPSNRLNHILKTQHQELYLELCNLTDNICTSKCPSILERLYILEHNIVDKNQLLCPMCNKNYRKFNYTGYRGTCSIVCNNKYSGNVNKRIQTRRANNDGNYCSKESILKHKQTCLERYGVTSFSKTEEYQKKVKATKLLRYNNENYNNTKQMSKTKEERYGSSSYNNIKKIRETFQSRYGVNSPVQIESVKRQQQNTCLERYGVKSFVSSNICKNQSKKMAYEKMLNNEKDIPFFTYEEYITYRNKHILQFKCKKCDTVFESFHDNGMHRSCPTCYPKLISKPQKEISKFLSDYVKIEENTRSIISPNELDVYIPDKKLAIEFDGLYWHCDEQKPNNYHLMKTEMCEKQGIQLIHIFENEWELKQDIVKSRLLNLLGIYSTIIYARKCFIKEVDSTTSKLFQELNHIQGSTNSKLNIGLFYNDELVSLMTFGKCRFDKTHEWELLRFCTKLGHHIPGAASKLLKYFERTYKPNSLISYADRRWSQGNLYKKLGFTDSHASKPNYWYWKRNEFELCSRIKYQKHKLKNILENFDENKTEIENMKANGYYRIFDCGNYVFKKEYNEKIT